MTRVFLALLVTLLVQSPLAAQFNEKWGVPGSPTGQKVGLLLEMVDRGDDDFTREMLDTTLPLNIWRSKPWLSISRSSVGCMRTCPDSAPLAWRGRRRAPDSALSPWSRVVASRSPSRSMTRTASRGWRWRRVRIAQLRGTPPTSASRIARGMDRIRRVLRGRPRLPRW